jgi:hypothetical protein
MDPNAVPDMRASEMRTMSFTPACASFFGIGRCPASGMPAAAGTCILQHKHVARLHVKRGVIDARGEVLEPGEHHRAAFGLKQCGRGCSALEGWHDTWPRSRGNLCRRRAAGLCADPSSSVRSRAGSLASRQMLHP